MHTSYQDPDYTGQPVGTLSVSVGPSTTPIIIVVNFLLGVIPLLFGVSIEPFLQTLTMMNVKIVTRRSVQRLQPLSCTAIANVFAKEQRKLLTSYGDLSPSLAGDAR